MSPLRFQFIVLRFIALWIRKSYEMKGSTDKAADLFKEVESEIKRLSPAMGIQERMLPAGIQTRHGQAVPFVEDQDGD